MLSIINSRWAGSISSRKWPPSTIRKCKVEVNALRLRPRDNRKARKSQTNPDARNRELHGVAVAAGVSATCDPGEQSPWRTCPSFGWRGETTFLGSTRGSRVGFGGSPKRTFLRYVFVITASTALPFLVLYSVSFLPVFLGS